MNNEVSALLINDLHLDKNNGHLIIHIAKQAVKVCKENDCDSIILGGDIFTNRSGQPLNVLKVFQQVLNIFNRSKLQVYAIPGNHDKTDSNSDESYLDLYDDQMTVFDNPEAIEINSVMYYFMPYFGHEVWVEKYGELVSSFDKNHPCNIMITHFAFDGVRNNDGTEVQSDFKNSKLEIFDKVLVGHYHNASKIGKNIYYTGSAYQNNYGESVEDKGFTLIYKDGTLQTVRSKFPKYLKVVLDVSDKENIRENIEHFKDFKEDFIRFIIKGKRVDCERFSATEISSSGIDVKFEIEETAEAIEIGEADIVLSHNKQSITKDFIKFCSEQAIRGKELKYGLQLIKETI